jgi:hypothetical protein
MQIVIKFKPPAAGRTNFVFVGAWSNNVGNNTSAAAGGGINIAIMPTAAAPGNCAKAFCLNLFGMQRGNVRRLHPYSGGRRRLIPDGDGCGHTNNRVVYAHKSAIRPLMATPSRSRAAWA